MEQKISKYSTATIVSLLCLLFSLPLQAQQQRPGARPAVKQKAKEEIKAVSYTHLTLPTTPYV